MDPPDDLQDVLQQMQDRIIAAENAAAAATAAAAQPAPVQPQARPPIKTVAPTQYDGERTVEYPKPEVFLGFVQRYLVVSGLPRDDWVDYITLVGKSAYMVRP